MKMLAHIGIMVVMAASAASAQEINAPAKELPPLPEAAKTASLPSGGNFPALPVSDPCQPVSVMGLWRLAQLYELPEGAEKATFTTSPMQYLMFRNNTTFARYNAGAVELPPADAIKQMDQAGGPLLQFVVQNGMVFFYQEQKASDTQACFIVREPQGAFQRGQMLLMPPKGQIQGRLVKVYQRAGELWMRSHPPAAATPAAPARQLTPEQQQRIQQLRQQRLQQQQQR